MGKILAKRRQSSTKKARPAKLQHLEAQLRRLESQRERIESQLTRALETFATKSMTSSGFARWLDELSEGSENWPALPADFSRKDIYDERD